ncbi:organic cation transporter protein-like [Watersipora subatra]|uniref:organic cation transporter protein-like n=1 Tax=Watersipora subatra TaxID=2589382 RepID=UPI00355B10BB
MQDVQTSEEVKNEDEVVRISYDEALVKYGSGRYQIGMFAMMSLVTWSTVFNNNGFIFIGGSQSHTCRPLQSSSNWSASFNETAKIKYELGECTYDTLVQYPDNSSIVLEKDVKCDSWDYDQTEFTLTMMSEWDLNSCNGSWYTTVANSLFMVGFLVGCIVLADLSDRYGRSKLLLISNVSMMLCGIAAAFSVNFYMLIVMRFLLGIFTAGARNSGFVYVCEMVTFRESAGMLHGAVYSIGGVVVTAISQLLSNWRHFQLACALCFSLYIPYYWIFPESPRWELNNGNRQKAIDFFRKSARINKVPIPKDFEIYIEHQRKKEGNLFTLFKGVNVRKKTIIVCVQWFGVSIVFFGMTFNVANLTGNIFTNNYLLQAVSMLQFVGIWYLRLGRRPAISSTFLIAAVVSAIIPVFAAFDINAAVIAMSMIGKLLIDMSFQMIYIITAEIYPTTERVTALGLGSSLARAGAALAPLTVYSNNWWPNLPYVIFGGLSLIAGLCAVTLPETRGKTLPDDMHQVETENLLNSFNCCKRKQKEREMINP